MGSGPSGFYAADSVLRRLPEATVDLLEMLPVPFGLLRSGVAPDAPNIKGIAEIFTRIADVPRLRFLGNVTVGKDIEPVELKAYYHAVILSYGAQDHQTLRIPGEELTGSYSANEFVGWYNGHPYFGHRKVDLSHSTAVVVGNGNVALDVVRMLAKEAIELEKTDIPQHVYDTFSQSKIRTIHLFGRRGPHQTSFSVQELEALAHMANCEPIVRQEDLLLSAKSRLELCESEDLNRTASYRALERMASGPRRRGKRRLYFHFYTMANGLLGTARLERVRFSRATLEQHKPPVGREEAKFKECEAGVFVRCIGYRGRPLPGLPFDHDQGIIPNLEGRVVGSDGVLPGFYVSGWIKHGPVGLVGHSKRDSRQTVDTMLNDLPDLMQVKIDPARDLIGELGRRQVRVVRYEDWLRIDKTERRRGQERGKPREKICSVQEMLECLNVD